MSDMHKKLSHSPAELAIWAQGLMDSRPPDFTIGENYMKRWWVIPRNELQNVYLHETTGSDSDEALHDHPFDNTSFILEGSYIEHTFNGSFVREPGDVIFRPAQLAHRLELTPGERVLSLFFTGPIVREWGFHCPKGWVHWKDYTNQRDNHSTHKGCA